MEFLLLLIADLFGGKPVEEPTRIVEDTETEKNIIQSSEEVPVIDESVQEALNIFNMINFR